MRRTDDQTRCNQLTVVYPSIIQHEIALDKDQQMRLQSRRVRKDIEGIISETKLKDT